MTRKLLFAGVLVLAFVVSQCAKETDEDALTDLINADSIWFNPNTEVDSTSDDLDQDTVAIWWRGQQTHDDPIIEIQVTGDSAWVSYSRGNFGHFYSLAQIDTMPWVLWDKNLAETAEVRATFLRTGTVDDEYRGWTLHTLSLAYGESDSNTVRIDSVRITTQTEAVDLLIADPLNIYFDVDSLLAFQSGEPVTLTLYTNVVDGDAFLHTFILAWPYYVRLPFTNMGNGVYEGTWNAQLVAVPRFAIFDLLSHSTIYTETEPYDFNGWLLPYTISP
jgi:hypothetical protein